MLAVEWLKHVLWLLFVVINSAVGGCATADGFYDYHGAAIHSQEDVDAVYSSPTGHASTPPRLISGTPRMQFANDVRLLIVFVLPKIRFVVFCPRFLQPRDQAPDRCHYFKIKWLFSDRTRYRRLIYMFKGLLWFVSTGRFVHVARYE